MVENLIFMNKDGYRQLGDNDTNMIHLNVKGKYMVAQDNQNMNESLMYMKKMDDANTYNY